MLIPTRGMPDRFAHSPTASPACVPALPLVIGQDLLEPYNFGIGRIFCFDTSNQGIDAGPDDLGERVKVYWFSPDEVTA